MCSYVQGRIQGGGPGPPLSENLGIDFYSGYRKNPGIHFYSGFRGNAQVGIDWLQGKKTQGGGAILNPKKIQV